MMYGPANRRGQISLNHLLNFSIAPREYHHFSNPSSSRRTPSYGIGSGHHPAGPTTVQYGKLISRQSTLHPSKPPLRSPSKRRLPSPKHRSRRSYPMGLDPPNPRLPANPHDGLSHLSFGDPHRPTHDPLWPHCLSPVLYPVLRK